MKFNRIMKEVNSLTFSLAAVGVQTKSTENFFIQINVVGVHGAVKSERDHLGYITGLQLSGNASTIS